MNKRITKLISLFLTLAMLVCLCACGNKGEGGQNDPKPGKNEPEETPEFTYVASYKSLGKSNNGLYPDLFTKDGFYSQTSEKVGNNTPEGVVPEWEGQYDIYETFLYFVSYDGTKTKLENYKPLDSSLLGIEIPENARESYSSSYINNMIEGEDGQLILIESVYASYNDAPDNVEQYSDFYWDYNHNEEKLYMRVIDSTGAEISCNEFDTSSFGYFYFYNGAVIDDNFVCVGDNGVCVFGLDGSFKFQIPSDYWFDNLMVLDGKSYAIGYIDDGYKLVEINLDTQSFGEKKSFELNGWNYITGGGDYDIYSNTGTSLFGYDFETGKSEKILSWINCDINGNNLNGYVVRDDGSVVTFENEWNRDYTECENRLVFLEKVPYESVPHKETITFACQYLDYNVMQSIIDFNRANDTYRIEVTDYSEYNTEEDWDAGITKLSTEIVAGKVPDILSLNGLPAKQYAAKGILADLYPYIDADPELDRSDFFENVLKACENNGGLYTTVSSFGISTVIGASSVVGDTPGWNYEQYKAALASMPEGCDPFDKYTTRDGILYSILGLDLDRFVDWNTGKCSFDTPEFIELLEFAAGFPETYDGDYEWTEEDDAPNRIASGRQMLLQMSIYNFSDIQMYDAMFGGSFTFIGWPTSEGNGSMIQMDTGYAMSSTCKAPEVAWEFLRTFFTADYQRDNSWNLPTNKEVYNEKLKEAMTPQYMTDENGNYILDENGEKIEMDMGSWGWGSLEIKIHALSQEEADRINSLVESTTRVYNYDDSIASIVTEQAAAFFSGQKSAADVAKLIQSKANLYVNEQR